MQYLKIENGKLVAPPTYDIKTGLVNCHLNEQWLVNNEYEQWTDEQIEQFYNKKSSSNSSSSSSESDILNPSDTTDFENACSHFRQICLEIRELINSSDFKGGYDDMIAFYSSDAYKTSQGMQLAIAWSGCNQLCKYQASKLGIGSPQWWYRCWSETDL